MCPARLHATAASWVKRGPAGPGTITADLLRASPGCSHRAENGSGFSTIRVRRRTASRPRRGACRRDHAGRGPRGRRRARAPGPRCPAREPRTMSGKIVTMSTRMTIARPSPETPSQNRLPRAGLPLLRRRSFLASAPSAASPGRVQPRATRRRVDHDPPRVRVDDPADGVGEGHQHLALRRVDHRTEAPRRALGARDRRPIVPGASGFVHTVSTRQPTRSVS